MKQLSLPAAVGAKTQQGGVKGVRPVAARRAPKAPSDEQYVKMAGAMENALGCLRVFHQTLSRAKEVTGSGGTGVPEIYRDNGAILLHPSEAAALLGEIVKSMNILRVGLKARIR